MKKHIIAMLILIPLTVGIGDLMAGLEAGTYNIYTGERTDSVTIQIVDSLKVYAAEAESLTVIDNILIECAN